ncbi:MAG: helix-turn-helix transcriptional regulator [Holophagaceae bacterium]|nr:helix-turn-helix transcriptional regulator [Holophagaceae bacterium]
MQPVPRQHPANDGAPSTALMSGVFLFIAVQFAVDLVWDRIQGEVSLLHQGFEILIGTVSLTLGLRLLLVLRHRGQAITSLKTALEASQQEADRWRAEAAQALEGLGRALDIQFERWNLSHAEREVALLLLKGFSTRDIAELRSTSERTVRQQAQDVYRKAGLAGRAELSAFFLEDLLLPTTHG